MSASAIPLKPGEELRLTREGGTLRLRIWFISRAGDWRPGSEGLGLPVRALDETITALQAVRTKTTGGART